MRGKRIKTTVFFMGTVLFVCGFAGCGGRDGESPVPTQTAGLTVAGKSTQNTEVKVTRTPVPEPVTFPVEINENTFPEELLRK